MEAQLYSVPFWGSLSLGEDRPDKKDQSLALESRPELLTTAVYDAIRKAILTRQIKPGERVTEASLAEKLSVSKTPVREAMMELRRVGLIVDWGKRGGKVIEPSHAAFQDVSEIREAVEVLISAKAAHVATAAQKQKIAELAKQSHLRAQADDREGFDRINLHFHYAIAEAAGNMRLARLLLEAFDLNSLLRARDLPPLNNLKQLADDHLEIARDIVVGNGEGAGAAARKHVLRTRTENLGAFARVMASGHDGEAE